MRGSCNVYGEAEQGLTEVPWQRQSGLTEVEAMHGSRSEDEPRFPWRRWRRRRANCRDMSSGWRDEERDKRRRKRSQQRGQRITRWRRV